MKSFNVAALDRVLDQVKSGELAPDQLYPALVRIRAVVPLNVQFWWWVRDGVYWFVYDTYQAIRKRLKKSVERK